MGFYGFVEPEEDEAYRINVMRLAVKLHQIPSTIESMPARDVVDLIAVLNGDAEVKSIQDRRAAR